MFNIFNKKDCNVSSDKNNNTSNEQAKEQESQSKGTTFVNENMADAQPQDIPRKEQ